MLPLENRLKKERDFENVFNGGEGFRSDFLCIKFISNNLASSRFGFIVSKKVSLKAVERNKIKRKLREIIRKTLPDIKGGYDIIVIVQPKINSDFDALERLMGILLKKTKLIEK
jgi:ribonuclease P protein component